MIDIIMTAYNAHDTIRKSLMSIELQAIKDQLKVYIIDDASEKPYDYLLDEFSDLDITLFRMEKNSGPGAARNKGLELSNSEFVMFLDSDDMFINEYSIRTLYNNMANYDLVIGVVEEEAEDGGVYFVDNADRCLHAKLYRRKIIDKYELRFPETYRHEDCAFHELYLFTNPKIYFINEYVYLYRYNHKSLTHTKCGYDEFLNYKSLVDSSVFAIKHAEKHKLNKHIMEDTITATLIFIYYQYQFWVDESYSEEIYEWIKPLVDFYYKNLDYQDKDWLLKNYINFGINHNIIPHISWDDFLKKASK